MFKKISLQIALGMITLNLYGSDSYPEKNDTLDVIRHWDESLSAKFLSRFVVLKSSDYLFSEGKKAYHCGPEPFTFARVSSGVRAYETGFIFPESWTADDLFLHEDHEVPNISTLIKIGTIESTCALVCCRLALSDLEMRLANKSEIATALKAIEENKATFTFGTLFGHDNYKAQLARELSLT